MKKLILCLTLALWAPFALALSPYIAADRVAAGEPANVMTQIEKKLQAEGFQVAGRHLPKGLPQYGVLIVTYKPLLDAIARMGGSSIVGAGIRVGVKNDGSISYMNPEYWYRAFFRKSYQSAMRQFLDEVKTGCGNRGIDYLLLQTDQPLAETLSHYLHARERFKHLQRKS